MVRRSFRLGWRLGAIAGFLLAVAKLVQSRRSSRDDAWAPAGGADSWPPVQAEPLVVEPPAATVADRMPPVMRAPSPSSADAAPPMAPAPPVTPAAPDPAPPVVPVPAPAPANPPPVVPPPAPPVVEPDEAPGVPPMQPDDTATAPAMREAPDPIPAPGGMPAARPARRPTKKAGTRRVRVRATWVEALGTECPTAHPVKAKLSSMLYHLPGMAAYNRTRPDRCYTEAAAAEADGFTRAKR